MSVSITSTDGPPHARKPLASQRSAGGDMSITFFVQPGCPSRFASSDQHRVKGLNAETIARVILPAPPWLTAADYLPLRTDPADPSPSIFFSLNLSIYNQQIVPEDWFDQWFFMAGRVHPFALTWEVERQDGLEESVDSGLLAYTIPALIVRDQGYQPILPRSLSAADQFPLSSPIVSFTGPVVGPGHALLRKESVPTLDNVQLKCCGFVQLTTFLAPGNPDKTPFRGFHPFQVFVIFPIRANPWASLCKKMAERRDTQFQSNVLLTCTGKVAGLLGHHLMVQPPTLEQDYVFIVVPDSWTFLDKGVSGPGSPTPPPGAATSAVRSSSSNHTPFEEIKAKFTARRPAAPPTPLPASTPTPASTPGESMSSVISTPSTEYHYLSTSPTPKRPASRVDYTPPAKRPRQPPMSLITIPSSGTHLSAGSSSSQETVDEPEPSCAGNQTPTASFMRPLMPATHLPAPTPVLDTITAAVSESSNRPSRNRHPPKNKYLEEVSKV
ncbi:hypothetical protein HZS61_010571 [Fusarium oxysporum f. sp. conglutinans]|uniref:Uncharacterized protein n=1 Tax=Fusarium oxysporum f. sp. conglutinans TaxID=100902 RepID=A0A8H6LN44_FUSOX|nr:hypothetical protein HZS61_010571 [Fusarium oxysporum f. sp. conglutinans]KAG6997099.1 hypothetical protein FocnCong_v016286 [Fusarium oxysporum f. sp. conglutinans]KAI8412271.1 hypothetical protein FOFC_08901 [Fusarium oxysporum]